MPADTLSTVNAPVKSSLDWILGNKDGEGFGQIAFADFSASVLADVMDSVGPRLRTAVDMTKDGTSTSNIQTVMAANLSVFQPANQPITLTSGLTVQDNARIYGEGATITWATTLGVVAFDASESDKWTIDDLYIIGSGNGTIYPPSGTAVAFKLNSSDEARLLNATVAEWAGTALYVASSGTDDGLRGNNALISNFRAIRSRVGIAVDPGIAAEYLRFVAPQVTGCFLGAEFDAGNTNIVGGAFTDNDNGVLFNTGSNPAHFTIAATQFNHNGGSGGAAGYNIKFLGNTLGGAFAACTIYGNSATDGEFLTENGGGWTFLGGIISARMRFLNGASSTYCLVQGNRFEQYISFAGDATALAKVFVLDNIDIGVGGSSGWSSQNDYSPLHVSATRTGNQTGITSGSTLLVMNNSSYTDKRGVFSNSTGKITAPWKGRYPVNLNLQVSAGGSMTYCYAEVLVNGVVIGQIPGVVTSTTTGFIGGMCIAPVDTINHEISFRLVSNGTSLAIVAGTQTRLEMFQVR